MGSHRNSVLSGIVVAMLATPALAADLPPIIEPPITPPLEHVGGWYIRGDIGYIKYDEPDVSFGTAVHLGNEDLDDTVSVGVGVGYQWNRYFRTDVTADYRFQSDFYSRTACAVACVGGFTTDESDIEVWTFLLNGYFDLGYYHGFTPYIGAGLGFAYIDISRLVQTAGPVPNAPIPGGDDFVFAASATAGVSYSFTEFLKMDANYRYVYYDDFTGDADSSGTRLTYNDIGSHEFRVGLRYSIY